MRDDATMVKRAVWVVVGVVALGCGDDDGLEDDGAPMVDLGPGADLGSSADLGTAEVDAFTPGVDLGPPGTGCGRDPGGSDQRLSVEHDGRTRTFLVHLPDGYDRDTPAPLVLNFHGRTMTATQQEYVTAMDAEADAEGFIAVHPQGVGNTWNVGFCCGEAMSADVDDVGFTAAMLDDLATRFCVDTARVYSTGLSNGGFMSHRLGCELSDRIAAIAPVAGTNVTTICSPDRAVPVFHFHGTNDTLVPYEGYTGGFASVDSTMNGWVTRNGCGATSAVYFDEGDVTCEEWTGCDDGASVRLCTVDGGGHQWPGGATLPGLGSNTDVVVATDAMWDFFAAHSL